MIKSIPTCTYLHLPGKTNLKAAKTRKAVVAKSKAVAVSVEGTFNGFKNCLKPVFYKH